MTITDFKSQLTKTFGKKMKEIGFTGSGFRYFSETEQFLFVFKIDCNEFKQIIVHFGIQPKAITQMGDFLKHNFKKIHPIDCELGKMLTPGLKKPFWNLPGRKDEVDQIAAEMFKMIQRQAMPVIKKFKFDPNLFDKIKPSDIADGGVLEHKLGGAHPAGLPTRTAWMLAVYYEKTDLIRAKAFARYGLDSLGKPVVEITEEIKELMALGVSGSGFGSDLEDDSFFGMTDLKRIAKAALMK